MSVFESQPSLFKRLTNCVKPSYRITTTQVKEVKALRAGCMFIVPSVLVAWALQIYMLLAKQCLWIDGLSSSMTMINHGVG